MSLFTELPRVRLLGNPDSLGPIAPGLMKGIYYPYRRPRRPLEEILVAVLGELGAMWPKVPVCGTLVVRSLVPVLGEREREDGHQVMGCGPIASMCSSQVTWAV